MKIQLRHFEILKSTNETAVAYAKAGSAEGTVVLADRQSGGHGRKQRVWESPEGGLWFSIILRPYIEPRFAAQLTLLAGVAAAQALCDLYDTNEIKIKWPNDLLWQRKKVCGILSEMQLDEQGDIDYVVIGIGINVNVEAADIPEELRALAASLNHCCKKNYTCEQVLKAILSKFEQLYINWLQEGAQAILPLWKSLNCTLSNQVVVKDDDQVIFQGTAEDIDAEGALIVRNEAGKSKRFDFGEISVR